MFQFKLQHWCIFAFMVSISTIALVHIIPSDIAGSGKHEWVVDGQSPCIDALLSKLRNVKSFEMNPRDLQEFADQLNTFVPTRLLPLDDDLPEDFHKSYNRIDRMLSMDRGLLMLLNEFDLDVAAQDGVLTIGSRRSSSINMTRIYDVPDVCSWELSASITNLVEPESWQWAGGNSQLIVMRNDVQTRFKLVVNAPRHVHCKIESMLEILAKRYGWKPYQIAGLFKESPVPLTKSPASFGGGCCGF